MKKVNRCLHLCRRQYSSVRAVIPCSGLQVVLIGAHMLLTQVKYKNIACMVLPADVEVNIFWDSVTSCIIGSIFRGHFQRILDVLSLLTSTFTWKSSYRPLVSRSTQGLQNEIVLRQHHINWITPAGYCHYVLTLGIHCSLSAITVSPLFRLLRRVREYVGRG